jgi:ribose transport system permease protein
MSTDANTSAKPSADRPMRGDVLRKASVAIGCVALFLVFSVLTSTFYQPSNLIDIMLQSSINAVIAVGMTLYGDMRGSR